MSKLTLNALTKVMPVRLKASVTQEMVDQLNAISKNPVEAETIRNNVIGYTGVLEEGRFKTLDYIRAVMFVSYKLLGNTNQQAYIKTFPNRYSTLIKRGATTKDISSYVAAYNRNKLVNLILEQTLVPTWVLNQDIYQKAINVQAELMQTSKSDFVRTQAANSLLTHLAKPKEAGPLINLDMRENSGMEELKTMLATLAQRQVDSINKGVDTKTIAEQSLVIENEQDAR